MAIAILPLAIALLATAQDGKPDRDPRLIAGLAAVPRERAAAAESAAFTLCSYIGNGKKEPNEDLPWLYIYQTKIYRAAGIAASDYTGKLTRAQEEEIRRLWSEVLQHVTCSNSTFDVLGGSLLKYAVSAQFGDFLFDVTHTWRVPLNKVDVADGRTVLDYVADKRAAAVNPVLKAKLKDYYDQLRAAGAKHRRELP